MLTEKQYASLGKLSLTFNHLDRLLERLIELYVSGGTDSSLARVVAAEGAFSQKASRLNRLLRVFREDHTGLAEETDVAIQFLKKALQLAEQRNAYIHALTSHDYFKNETRLVMKGVETVCDETEVCRLDSELLYVYARLGSTATEVFNKTLASK